MALLHEGNVRAVEPLRPVPVRYMPQLDALRAFAVVAVWFEHWGDKGQPFFGLVPWGSLGVWLFFVLSGFLITGILLRARDGVADGRGAIWPTARNFYIRRFLRILPIYYLTLFVMTALAGYARMPGLRAMFPYHLTYTTNLYFSRYGFKWNVGGHFWTLAVEEQFYLLWPWIILLVPRARLLTAAGLAVIGGVMSRVICASTGHGDAAGMLMTSCLDLFALGALLAMLDQQTLTRGRGWSARHFGRMCLWVGLPCLLGLLVLRALHHGPRMHPLNLLLDPLAAGLLFTWLIGGAAQGFGGATRVVLECRPILYIGRISYGLYVFHPFVKTLLIVTLARLGHTLPAGLGGQLVIPAMATLVVASGSWHLIEKPINGLKRHFKYVPAGLRKPSIAPVASG